MSSTFKPSTSISQLAKLAKPEAVEDAEFASKRWLWIPDSTQGFIKGFVKEECSDDNTVTVRCTDGSDRKVPVAETDKVNPPQFDRSNDMAELTYLNEASVVHNLEARFFTDEIYTYSGLFLVAVNPYKQIPIYSHETIIEYKNKLREETKPHIYAITDLAFRNMLEVHDNQSILVTGESGAGKTENTKKVIQYLASITCDSAAKRQISNSTTFEDQIIQANPILESFGNAQTVRNNNSSRFGKFIRIEFARSGQIAGAQIDWYLLEKSRVIHQAAKERNYHVFYQLVSGASQQLRSQLLLNDDTSSYNYLKHGNQKITGVNDAADFQNLLESLSVLNIVPQNLFKVISAILHIGNIEVIPQGDQARIENVEPLEKACHLLGISPGEFSQSILRPKVKAGAEWVIQNKTAQQVRNSLDALSKSIYERTFGYLVDLINQTLQKSSDNTTFIGVLDIAGFEIFDTNSFEQLCINYTNERLQQFFNHHMFVLEQDEYSRENIEWKYVDFGHDLQPTIDLIEKSRPMGIFSSLDEDCIMPKATDKSFTEKLSALWKDNAKFKASRRSEGFTLTHYAANVEYTTEGWLEKNKDPLNDNVVNQLVDSTDATIRTLFTPEKEAQSKNVGGKVKRGIFRTVAQRHKEQLHSLMTLLNSTHPHFVRCILPNHEKMAKKFDKSLVLDQLRCNGVLEGIRIARSGFPNRLFFSEFRQRYEVLIGSKRSKTFVDGKKACQTILQDLNLSSSLYRIGLTKVFFKSGVLADLEERREAIIRKLVVNFQAISRGYLQRRDAQQRIIRAKSAHVIKSNLNLYLELKDDPWWRMFTKMKPLLIAARESGQQKANDAAIKNLESQIKQIEEEHKRDAENKMKAENELKKITEALEAERLLAIDKEEILSRSQKRVVELEDQLSSAFEDLEDVEGQLEKLLEAKKKVEIQCDNFKKDVEKAAALIASLEAEKNTLKSRVTSLESKMLSFEQAQSELENLKAEKDLHNQRSLDLGESLSALKEEYELLKRSSAERDRENEKNLQSLSEQKAILTTQLTEYQQSALSSEDQLKKKSADLKRSKDVIEDQQRLLKKLQADSGDRQAEVDRLQKTIDVQKKEFTELTERCFKAEESASQSIKLLQERTTDHEKVFKSRKLVDQKLADTTAALEAAKVKHEGEVAAKSSLIEELRSKLNKSSESNNLLQDSNNALSKTVDSLKAQVLQHEQYKLELDKLKEKMKKSEEYSAKIAAERADLKKELEAAHSNGKGFENRLQEADNLNKSLTSQLKNAKTEIQTLTSEKEDSMMAKSQLSKELMASNNKCSSLSLENSKLESDLKQRNNQMEKLRSSVESQVSSRMEKFNEENKALMASERLLKESLKKEQLEKSTLQAKAKKLQQEIEDLNNEVSQEKRVASSLREQLRSIEKRAKSEAEVLQRKLTQKLEKANADLEEKNLELQTFKRVLPKNADGVDLAKQLVESERARKAAEDKAQLVQEQMEDAKRRWSKELDEKDSKFYASRRALLDDLAAVNASAPPSPKKSSSVSSTRSPSKKSSSILSDDDVEETPRPLLRTFDLDPSARRLRDRSANIETKVVPTLASGKENLSGKSMEELEEMFAAMRESKGDLLEVYHETSKNLVTVKDALAAAKQETRDVQKQLRKLKSQSVDGRNLFSDNNETVSEIQSLLTAEKTRSEELEKSVALYKRRADEYYSKLESAEAAVLKAIRTEQFAKDQSKEAESRLFKSQQDVKDLETKLATWQSKVRKLEDEFEDKSVDYNHLQSMYKRSQQELEELRQLNSEELSTNESTINAIRDRYANELKLLATELEAERLKNDSLVLENRRTQEQLDRINTESLKDMSWTKKNELENELDDLKRAREESLLAQHDSQLRIGSLLSQVRTLRENMEDLTNDRDQLLKDKRGMESRMNEMSRQLEQLAAKPSTSPQIGSKRDSIDSKRYSVDPAVQQKLKQSAERLEANQKILEAERKKNEQLASTNSVLSHEKQSLSLKLIDLESRLNISNGNGYLQKKVSELESQIAKLISDHKEELKKARNSDRSVKDVELQLRSSGNQMTRMQAELEMSEEKSRKLLQTIEKMNAEISKNQVALKRTEREARKAKEDALLARRDLEDWRARFERTSGSQFV